MPFLTCRCGHVIDLSPIPCPNEFALISDQDMEVVFEAIESSPSTAADILESVRTSVVKCDICGRYYINASKKSVDYIVLAPESADDTQGGPADPGRVPEAQDD